VCFGEELIQHCLTVNFIAQITFSEYFQGVIKDFFCSHPLWALETETFSVDVFTISMLELSWLTASTWERCLNCCCAWIKRPLEQTLLTVGSMVSLFSWQSSENAFFPVIN